MFKKKYEVINRLRMAYFEYGLGDPIIFLHGNPTSSYIWRNIIPHLKDLGRCIAPDLPGMGDSEKLADPNAYTFAENQNYLEHLFRRLGITQKIIFVVHDWGSALAFNWVQKYPYAVRGIVYMESIIKNRDWSELPPIAQELFRGFRSEKGEELVLQQNAFIEVNLPRSVLRGLSKKDHDEYRRPFLEPGESRRSMLSWARQLPISGDPENIAQIVHDYGGFLAQSTIPKLFIEASPGTLSPSEKEFCKSWANQKHIILPGHHHLQEDVPDEIGMAIADWIRESLLAEI